MTKISQIIKAARDQSRLTALDFAQGIFDDFVELHGDRGFRDDGAVIGGIGTLNGQPAFKCWAIFLSNSSLDWSTPVTKLSRNAGILTSASVSSSSLS